MASFDPSLFDTADDEALQRKLEEARAALAGAREGNPTSLSFPAASPHAAPAAVGAATLSAADVYGFRRLSEGDGAAAECAASPPPSGADARARESALASRISAAPRAVDAVASIRAWTLRLCGGPTATGAAFVRREQYYRFHALLQQFMSVSHGVSYDSSRSADEAAVDWAHDLGGPREHSEAQTMGCAVFERALHEFAAAWAGALPELGASARVHEAADLLECVALFFDDLHEPDAVAARGGGSSRGVAGGSGGGGDAEEEGAEEEGEEGAGGGPAGLDALNARVAAGRASIELADARARESLVDAREGRQARLRARLAEEREALGAQNEARLRDVRAHMAESGLYHGAEFIAATK